MTRPLVTPNVYAQLVGDGEPALVSEEPRVIGQLMAEAPFRYAEPYVEGTMGQSIKTQLSDSVRKLSMLSRQVSGVAATDLTPRERGDLIAELQSLATTFDTLARTPLARRC